MHERQRRLDVGVRQIGKHAVDLRRRQHALVDQRLRRQADDVEVFRFALDALADDIELALEGDGTKVPSSLGRRHFPGRRHICAANKQLLESRGDRGGRLADLREVDRHVAPAQQGLALLANDA